MMNSGAVVRNLIVGVAAAMLLAGCGSSVARYNNRGNEAFAQGDYVAALDEYRQAQQEDPDVSAPYYNYGTTYHQEGKIDYAIPQLKQANRTAAAPEPGRYRRQVQPGTGPEAATATTAAATGRRRWRRTASTPRSESAGRRRAGRPESGSGRRPKRRPAAGRRRAQTR